MNNIGEGALKGSLIAAIPSVAYSMADRPAEGLLTMAIGGIAGATAAAMKRRKPTANRKGEFIDSHGKAVGFNEAANWDKDF